MTGVLGQLADAVVKAHLSVSPAHDRMLAAGTQAETTTHRSRPQ